MTEKTRDLEDLQSVLIERVNVYIDKEGVDLILSSIEYAHPLVEGIKDVKGDEVYLHALRTAILLTELHSDPICIAACLTECVPRYLGEEYLAEVRERFQSPIGDIVESLYKISNLKLKDDGEKSAIYLRKVLVGLSSDVRVIVIKLASRLDNLKEVYTEPSKEQKDKCIETESVLIPIAHRLGINYIKSELEDLCLKYLKPDIYEEILENLNADREELQGYIDEMMKSLSEILDEHDIKYRIKGRVKSVHSLYTKLATGRRWKDIYDVLALRIIVEKEAECYLAIGLIHAKYRPIPKRFKDYIAQPKENMYQSLHTGVIGPDGRIFEIQIRTEDMDEIAECGIASHWSYKEHGTKSIQNLMEQKLELFRNSLEVANDEEEAEENFREVFLENMIYVFTPSGDVIELPEGATPVDFAYKIHSHIGNTLTGAIVNDKIVPVDTALHDDDIVKIMTSETSTPNKEWLNFVKTNQAKNKIKAYFNKHVKEEYIKKGEGLLLKEIKKRNLLVKDVLTEESIDRVLKDFKLSDFDEVKLAIGSLHYTAAFVLNALTEEKSDTVGSLMDKISKAKETSSSHKGDIVVEGCDEVLVTTANCCKPVYGDDIIGYISKGEGIIVHKTNCPNIKNMESRFIDVSWCVNPTDFYATGLYISTNSLKNNVPDIVTKATHRDLTIEAIETKTVDGDLFYKLQVRVPSKEKLEIFMNDLESLPYVGRVERRGS